MTADSTCPHCGVKHDQHTAVDSPWARPKEGSVSFCISCGNFGLFTEDLKLRAPTDEERGELLEDPQIKRILEAYHTALSKHIAAKRERGEIH